MRSFFRGNLGLVGDFLRVNQHEPSGFVESVEDFLCALREAGFLDGRDEFHGFADFDKGSYVFRIHGRFSAEHHCSVCGTIAAGTEGEKCRQVGCGGILAPTISRDPPQSGGALPSDCDDHDMYDVDRPWCGR